MLSLSYNNLTGTMTFVCNEGHWTSFIQSDICRDSVHAVYLLGHDKGGTYTEFARAAFFLPCLNRICLFYRRRGDCLLLLPQV